MKAFLLAGVLSAVAFANQGTLNALIGDVKASIKRGGEPNFAPLNKYLDDLEAHSRAYGSFALKYGPGPEKLYTRRLGFLDGTKTSRPDALTTFRVGSITKTFTAVLAMLAVERNLLRLEDTLEKFLPSSGIRFADKITIQQMLTMQCGLGDYLAAKDFDMFQPGGHSLQNIVDAINSQQDGQADPDTITRGKYSNSAYYLLGAILEQAYGGKAYADILKNEIFDPLGMVRSSLYGSAPTAEKNEVASFTLSLTDEDVTFVPNTRYTLSTTSWSAGGIQSTAEELVSFAEQVFVHHKIITKASVRRMLQWGPMADGSSYGMGLFPLPWNNSFGHNGAVDDFHSMWSLWPAKDGEGIDPVDGGDDHIVAVYCANAVGARSEMVLDAMVKTAAQLPFSAPDLAVLDNESYYGNFSGTYAATTSSSNSKNQEEGGGNGKRMVVGVNRYNKTIAPQKSQALWIREEEDESTKQLLTYYDARQSAGQYTLQLASFVTFSMESGNGPQQMSINTPDGQELIFHKISPEPNPEDKEESPATRYVVYIFVAIGAAAALAAIGLAIKRMQRGKVGLEPRGDDLPLFGEHPSRERPTNVDPASTSCQYAVADSPNKITV